MSENKEKVSSKEVGLEIGLVISRFLYKTEHLHYGYWPDDLAIIPENVGKAQDLHSKLIMDTIPEDVETILGPAKWEDATERARGGWMNKYTFNSRWTREIAAGRSLLLSCESQAAQPRS